MHSSGPSTPLSLYNQSLTDLLLLMWCLKPDAELVEIHPFPRMAGLEVMSRPLEPKLGYDFPPVLLFSRNIEPNGAF
jgi:hypothetical protein